MAVFRLEKEGLANSLLGRWVILEGDVLQSAKLWVKVFIRAFGLRCFDQMLPHLPVVGQWDSGGGGGLPHEMPFLS